MHTENARMVSLRERVNRVEAARKAARRSGWMRVLLGVFLFLLCLPWVGGIILGSLWTLGNVLVDDPSVPLVLIVTLASAAIAIGSLFLLARALFRWLGDAQPAYAQSFRQQVTLPSLREALPGLSPILDGPITLQDFDASALFLPNADDFSAPFGFHGNAGALPFRGSMLDVRKLGYSHEHRMQVRVPFFRGIFLHMAHPVPLPSTLRLVHAQVYEGWDRNTWDIKRRAHTVKARGNNPHFDAVAMVVLDEQHDGMPPVPPALLQAWLELDALIGKPVFLAFNQSGIYLAVATGTERLLLEPRTQFANRPEELADELALLQRTVQGVEVLRKALAFS